MRTLSNSFANLAGNLISIGTSFLLVPVYVRYLGLEAYGLVGFFTTVSSWFALLDLGLLPSLAREMSAHRAGETTTLHAARTFSAVENLFWAVSLISGVIWSLLSDGLATEWFAKTTMTPVILSNALMAMGATIAVRFGSSAYRNALVGLGDQVYLNIFSSAYAITRALCIILALSISPSIVTFFICQLLTTVVEAIVLRCRVCMQLEHKWRLPKGQFIYLRPLLKLGLATAGCSLLWVSLTQIDKLILSRTLSLKDFGALSVSLAIVNMLPIIATAIGQGFTPELVALRHETKIAHFNSTFLRAIGITSVALWPPVAMIALFPEEIVWVWTGNAAISPESYLPYYALGQGVVGILSLFYIVQFSKGDLSLHLKTNTIFSILFLVALWWASSTFGARGASLTWFASNLFYIVTITPLVLRKFLPGMQIRSLLGKISATAAVPLLSAALISHFVMVKTESRYSTLLGLFFTGIVVAAVTYLFSSAIGLVPVLRKSSIMTLIEKATGT